MIFRPGSVLDEALNVLSEELSKFLVSLFLRGDYAIRF